MNDCIGQPAGRRGFLKGAAAALAVPAAISLVGGLADPAHADTSSLPDYAPVPPGALGPSVNADGYYVANIAGNLYWATDSYYLCMFLSTRRGIVLVDAPPTIGNNLLRAIQDVTQENGRPSTVTHLVYSHSHADHIGASALFGPDVTRIAHANTLPLLARDADPNRPLPNVTFQDRYDLEVGGEHLRLEYHGPNHAPDNIFIYAPEYATLMAVDILFPGWVPFDYVAVSQDIPDWITAQSIVMEYPWETLVGGHLGRLGVRADGPVQIQYMADLVASVKATYSSLDPSPYFANYAPQGNAWAIFKTFLLAVAEAAAAPVTAKYTGVLAAADVYTVDNAWTVMESLRIDNGFLGPFGIHP